MREVSISGVGMTPFGKFEDQSLATLGQAAIREALTDAGSEVSDIDMVIHANAIGGLITGQEMIRGQVVTSDTGLAGLPLINIENACASSSSGIHTAMLAIQSGHYNSVLVVGSEKMTGRGTRVALDALRSAADVDRLAEYNRELTGSDADSESFFMAIYAHEARQYMERSGATPRDFAAVAAKNSRHGALNPLAQYRVPRSVDEVMASRAVVDPLTMLMCSPVADGSAAILLQASDRVPDERRADAVRLRASVVLSGIPGGGETSLERRTAERAYGMSGLEPQDVDVVELHDAASPSELIMTEELGFCPPGDGLKLLAAGDTTLGGRIPINPSGGLVSKGHPVGATGAAQVVELVTQLRGRAGDRQSRGARVGLAENAGGYAHPEPAACAITILSKD